MTEKYSLQCAINDSLDLTCNIEAILSFTKDASIDFYFDLKVSSKQKKKKKIFFSLKRKSC